MPSKSAMILTIIVPAYNEEERIEELIVALRAIKDRLAEKSFEQLVYVINDGSTDRTEELAEEAGADRVLRPSRPCGGLLSEPFPPSRQERSRRPEGEPQQGAGGRPPISEARFLHTQKAIGNP